MFKDVLRERDSVRFVDLLIQPSASGYHSAQSKRPPAKRQRPIINPFYSAGKW